MKTIVLATDFSPMANQAAMFANQLAHDQKAGLILLHVYQGWATDPARTEDVFRSENTVRANSEKALQQLADTLSEGGLDVPIRSIAHEGSVKATLRLVSQSEGADLLVMSTVGSTPQTAQIMGSVASELIAETEIPLLLIPPGVTYAGLKNVVLCINLAAPPDTIAFGRALGFARSFGSVVNVLCISDKLDDADTHEQAKLIRQLLIRQPHTFTIGAGGREIYDTLLDFAHDNNANLIMMLPQMRSWFWRLFSEGETQRMARLTDIPLLAVV